MLEQIKTWLLCVCTVLLHKLLLRGEERRLARARAHVRVAEDAASWSKMEGETRRLPLPAVIAPPPSIERTLTSLRLLLSKLQFPPLSTSNFQVYFCGRGASFLLYKIVVEPQTCASFNRCAPPPPPTITPSFGANICGPRPDSRPCSVIKREKSLLMYTQLQWNPSRLGFFWVLLGSSG